MDKKKINFKEQTPDMLIGEKENPLYKKAYLEAGEDICGEFCQNTTTWD